MRTLTIIIALLFLYPNFVEAHNYSATDPNHTYKDVHTGYQGWMNEIFYFPPYGSYFPVKLDLLFGDFYIIDEDAGLVYHPRTASYWYFYGESMDSLFMYGPTIAEWAWTAIGIYPWIYFYWPRIPDLIHPGWGRLDCLEIRPDGEIWARMFYSPSGDANRVIMPF